MRAYGLLISDAEFHLGAFVHMDALGVLRVVAVYTKPITSGRPRNHWKAYPGAPVGRAGPRAGAPLLSLGVRSGTPTVSRGPGAGSPSVEREAQSGPPTTTIG